VFAYGLQALAVSSNGGGRWTVLRLPAAVKRVRAVDFVSDRAGFVLDGADRLWRTADRARHWTELATLGGETAGSMSFSDVLHGYVVASKFSELDDRGVVLRTSDGGRSWRPQLVAATPLVRDGVAALDTVDALALTADGSVFVTATGGDAGVGERIVLSTPRRDLRRRKRRPRFFHIRVSGRITPAVPGAKIVISSRDRPADGWSSETATVDGAGRFSLAEDVSASTIFVAQWPGDGAHDGAASAALTVRVR